VFLTPFGFPEMINLMNEVGPGHDDTGADTFVQVVPMAGVTRTW
jgi:hypothetical protein